MPGYKGFEYFMAKYENLSCQLKKDSYFWVTLFLLFSFIS